VAKKNLQVTIIGDATSLKRTLKGAGDDVNKFSSKVSGVAGKLGSALGSVLRKVTNLALGVVGTLTGIGTAIGTFAIKGGIERALATEDAIVGMRRLGLEVDQIDKLVQAVDETFDGTVFSNPEGFALTQRLIGLGVELDNIPGYIKTISDMAAHGNVPLDQMSSIIERIISNNRVSNEEINRLADANIPLTALAEALGMTVEEMRNVASNGELSAEAFLEAAASVEMFDGAAKAAGTTTRGAFKNTITQLKVLGEQLIKPMFGEGGPLVRLFTAARQALIDIRPYFKDAGEQIGNFLVPKIEALSAWLESGGLPDLIENVKTKFSDWQGVASELWVKVQEGIDTVQGFITKLKESENPFGQYEGLLTSLKDTFIVLSGPMSLIVRELMPALMPVISALLPPLATLAQELAPSLAEVMASIAGAAIPVLVSALDGLANLLRGHPEVVYALIAAFAAFKTVMMVQMVGQMIPTVTKAWTGLTALFKANPWALLISFIVALVTIVIANWDKIKEYLSKVWNWIKDTAASVGQWFKDRWNDALEFVKRIFSNFTGPGLLIKHWNKIKSGIRNVVNFFKDKWNSAIDFFRELPGKISDAARGMWDGIKNNFRDVLNSIIRWWNGLHLELRIPSNAVTDFFGISGKGFRIDTPNIPLLHQGGIVPGRPGEDVLAILQAGEKVIPVDEVKRGEESRLLLAETINFYGTPERMVRDVAEATSLELRLA